MARVSIVTVTLTANQANGTDPVLAAEGGAIGIGTRRLLSIASRSAAAIELFTNAAGAAGAGIPIAIGGRFDLPDSTPGFDSPLYLRGATAGEKIVLLLA